MAKKKVQKKVAKKTLPKQKKVKIIVMDDVYRLLNRVQLNKKEVSFSVKMEDASIAENVVKDCGLQYQMKNLKTRTTFTIFPNPEETYEEADIEFDFFADEAPENGQVF